MSRDGYGPDLRLFIGAMFVIVGAILAAFGLLSPGIRAPLTQQNVNLDWGLVLLVFGIVMLALGVRAERRAKSQAPGPRIQTPGRGPEN